MSNRWSLEYEKIHFCFAQKKILEEMIFNLENIFLWVNSLSNLINVILLNNNKIYYNNKNAVILYNVNIREVLVQTKK